MPKRDFNRRLRTYVFIVLVVLVINLLTNPARLWFHWVAISLAVMILVRWLLFHVPATERQPAAPETPERPAQDGRVSSQKQRTLVVQVEPKGGGDDKEERVNIRIPLRVLKAGVQLGAVLPERARGKIESAMKEHGLEMDLFSMDRGKLSEMLDAMGELRIEVERDERTVRIFCE